jgi:hypothetical protein
VSSFRWLLIGRCAEVELNLYINWIRYLECTQETRVRLYAKACLPHGCGRPVASGRSLAHL